MRRLSALLMALTALAAAATAQAPTEQRQMPFPIGGKPPSATKQTPAETTPTQPGREVLLRVLAMLEQRTSIAARVRHQMNYEGQHLYGTGNYWQQGRGQNLRIRLELKFAGYDASLVQVADGRYLWTDRQLPMGRRVSLVDLRRLRAEAATPGRRQQIDPGRAAWSPIEPELLAFHGGLPMLMGSLEKNFEFSRPTPMQLKYSPPLVNEPRSIRVFATVGRWKSDRLPPIARDGEADLSKLPPRFPTDVLILVGQENDFPYRIEYRRSFVDAAKAISSDPSALYQLNAQPLVVLEFSDEQFDENVNDTLFRFEQPSDVEVDDQTSHLVKQIQKDRERLAKRPSP